MVCVLTPDLRAQEMIGCCARQARASGLFDVDMSTTDDAESRAAVEEWAPVQPRLVRGP